MKTTKLMRCALFAAVLAAFGLVGCEQLEPYSIGAPADLQSKIDSIANSKPDTGDTTYINIATKIVGLEDNSAGWWAYFSDYFAVPTNKRLVLEFINYGNGANDWNNWVVVTANGERGVAGYAEHFAFRSDAEGWSAGNSNFDPSQISHNLPVDPPTLNDSPAEKAEFIATMNGASVKLEIDHSATGYIFLSAKSVGTNGKEIILSYNQPIASVDKINAFLVCDGSHYAMNKAYLLPSRITAIDDVNPISIAITGTPTSVEIGDEDFWGDGIATVTYADGSSEVVDTADISFNVIPEMSSLGTKTVVVAYSKTKQGAYCKAVSTYYNLVVTNSVVGLEVTTMPNVTTYTFPGPAAPYFNATGMVVTATYSDGSKGVIENKNLQFMNPGGNGSQNAVITYVGATSTVTTTYPITNVIGGINQVGATDFSSGWWTAFSNEYKVASGSTKIFTMHCYSTGANNWNAPVTILRKANLAEYAVVRMDNFGWGDGYGTATATADWNWDIFKANINNSDIKITVTNNGNNTADILYNVTYASGETHFQKYAGVTVDSSDLNCAITIDGCYVEIKSVE